MHQTLKTLTLACAAAVSLQACVPLVVAGVGTGVSATLDRRSYNTQLEDSKIEVTVMSRINEKLDKTVNISTTSMNRWVLLTGQANDENGKQTAANIAATTQGVRKVFNEVMISPSSKFGDQANDTLTTSHVKTRLLNPEVTGISGHNVKIITEFGVVYLMGVVTESEAATAVNIARTTSGVQKVINLFEVLSDEEIRKLETKTAPPPATSQR